MAIYNARLTAIDASETRRYAGLSKAANFDERSIVEACEEAGLLIEVRGIWKMYDYDSARSMIMSEPPVAIVGRSIEKHLSKCERVVCMAVTVGEAIEREVTSKFGGKEYVKAMLLDAAATTAVEQAADQMEQAIRREVEREGFSMRSRYSPGYGDWGLDQQKELFRLTGASEIGMRLSTALMLMPRKSVTAIIGLTRATVEKKSTHDCAACDKVDCPMRDLPQPTAH